MIEKVYIMKLLPDYVIISNLQLLYCFLFLILYYF
jgi:hypothetical protein